MLLTSTRNKNSVVSFSEGVLNCLPNDGGLYVPSVLHDLRRWIMYTNENTTFQSIAGALTSAFINEEFSPIICEKIVTEAFPFAPTLKQLDDNLFVLELFHGYTGCHRDFGISYLCACLETILTMKGGKAILLDYTNGELGSILAHTLKNKKNIKAVLVCRKGEYRGLSDDDLFWNGGNIYPVEVDDSVAVCKSLISDVFSDREFSVAHGLTVANTANFCRLLGHVFYYPFAFSRMKSKVQGDIYYALSPGNYANLVAGLYSWKFALPLGGFILPSTGSLTTDAKGNTLMLDSMVSLEKRSKANPSDPSNLERLEEIFSANSLMIRNFVYPSPVTSKDEDNAARELFKKFGMYSNKDTASAYAAMKNRADDIFDDGGAAVIIARDDPSLSQNYCLHLLGEAPKQSENVARAQVPFTVGKPCVETSKELKQIIDGIWRALN